MNNTREHTCAITGHEQCTRASAQILLLTAILLIVFLGTNILALLAARWFYPVVYPGAEMKLMRHAMMGSFNYFLVPSFLIPAILASWYMAPLYSVFIRWGQNPDLRTARRRLLNSPVILSAISFGGWLFANTGLIYRIHMAGAAPTSLVFIKSIIVGFAMQSLSVIITFYFMESMNRRHLMPILFRNARLSDCHGSIVIPIKVRFLLYYFSVCIYPMLLYCCLSFTIIGKTNLHGYTRLIVLMSLSIVVTAMFLTHMIASSYRMPLVWMKQAAGRIRTGDYNVDVPVYSNDEIGNLGDALNEMASGLRERDLVKDAFSRYVTRQVADEILQNPAIISLGGRRQEVTILFADIRAFSTFSESHEPEEVISRLNEYLSEMVDVIFKYEGTLDKYIGDGIMAVFGTPLPHADDPLRAVRTALEMQQRLTALNDKWGREGKEQFAIGIGINTGDAIAGNIGDIRRMEYTVIGDNVNLASRVENLTKKFNRSIIITESTYEKTKDKIKVEKLGAVTVKGRTQPVEIYELLALNNT